MQCSETVGKTINIYVLVCLSFSRIFSLILVINRSILQQNYWRVGFFLKRFLSLLRCIILIGCGALTFTDLYPWTGGRRHKDIWDWQIDPSSCICEWGFRGEILGKLLSVKAFSTKCSSCTSCDQYRSGGSCFITRTFLLHLADFIVSWFAYHFLL